jgi:hypothetical protein
MPVLTPSTFLSIIREAGKLTIEEFCEYWIPKLYNIYPDDRLYRRACTQELVRISDDKIKRKSIVKNWILFGEKAKYPDYIEPILTLADTKYKMMEVLKVLPKYTLDSELDE